MTGLGQANRFIERLKVADSANFRARFYNEPV
jgi:hypothetical protein